MNSDRSLPIEALLSQSDWVTALARALVADPATADDVAQSAWVDVLQSKRHSIVDPRAWLATIVRRKALRAQRTEARRQRRERAADEAAAPAIVPSAADLAARIATHRELVDEVLALDEPYRETIVLRFFENLGIDAIAGRMQTKANTVRSRLQRGLVELRERFDRSHGGRERWMPAVVGLAQRQLASEAAAVAATGGIAATVAMNKIAFAAVAVLVATLVTLPMLGPPAETIPPVAAAPLSVANTADVAPATQSRDTNTGPSQREPGAIGSQGSTRSAILASPVPEPTPARRLVDRDGKGLANVLLRAAAPTTVRWQGGERGWIAGAGCTIRILPDEEQRLITDRAHAFEFFKALPSPDEWRAAVLGTSLPARETRSDAEGSFVFDASLGVVDAAVEVVDPFFVLITAGRANEAPWVAGPATRVEGSVHDIDGAPIAGATAIALGATDPELALPGQPSTRSDEDGAFLVRRALAEGRLRVSCDGFEGVLVPLSRDPVQRPYVVLKRPAFSSRRTMDGTVTETGGRPIANASVSLGPRSTKTAGNGRFTLAIDAVGREHGLTITAKGWAPFRDDDFGAQILGGAPTHKLTFVLDKKAQRMRGRVIDKDGSPVAGAMVFLANPTLLDTAPDSAEARVAERDDVVRTAEDGSFVLDGLGERRYSVRAVDPATGASAKSDSRLASDGDFDLILTEPSRDVRGVVQDAEGKPLRSATVENAFFPHVPNSGAARLASAASVTCDDNGRFVLPALAGTWLCVRVHGTVRQIQPIEDIMREWDGTVVRCTGSRWLRLVGNRNGNIRRVRFQLADGMVEAKDRDGRVFLWEGAGAAVVPVPADAVAVIVGHDSKDGLRVALSSDPVQHVRMW